MKVADGKASRITACLVAAVLATNLAMDPYKLALVFAFFSDSPVIT